MPTIKVTIKEDGEVEVAPEGFPGAKCKNVTSALEKALGTVTEDTETSEMYEQPEQNYETEGEM